MKCNTWGWGSPRYDAETMPKDDRHVSPDERDQLAVLRSEGVPLRAPWGRGDVTRQRRRGWFAGTDRGPPHAPGPGADRQPRGDLPVALRRGAGPDLVPGAAPPPAQAPRLLPPAHEGPHPVAGGDHRTAGGRQWPPAAGRLGGRHTGDPAGPGRAAAGGGPEKPLCGPESVATPDGGGHAGRLEPLPGAFPVGGAPDDHL